VTPDSGETRSPVGSGRHGSRSRTRMSRFKTRNHISQRGRVVFSVILRALVGVAGYCGTAPR
jgi:hypothetical protein